MKHLALLLAALLALPAFVHSDDTPLAEQMETISRSTKKLRRLDDGDFSTALTLAREAVKASEKSRDLRPAMVEAMPAGDAKDAAIAEYKAMIKKMEEGFKAVIAAAQAKDDAALKSCVKALLEMKKQGHEKFIEEE